MDINLKDKFVELWSKYFNGAELPITFYYADNAGHAELAKPGQLAHCVIAALAEIRKGRSFTFNVESVGCFGGKRYLGFVEELSPNFDYFLSCGIPGKVRGERYKKSPELVRESLQYAPKFKASAPFIVFKRWDFLESFDNPEVVTFFAPPDVISGLFTLASYDEAEPNGVFTPFGSGCSSIVQYPYLEKDAISPRGVIGLFDISARPWVPANVLTFSVPISKFSRMVNNMAESFLITESWQKVQKRISPAV
jgi:uncharacterized protein (DUF169 family)